MLKRFLLRTEVKGFMENSRLDVPELDEKWIMYLAFLVDIRQELNTLNLQLQGPGQLISTAYESVKTEIVENSTVCKNLCHFDVRRSLVEECAAFSGDEYVSSIENLQREFDERFDTFQLFADPFSADVENVPSVLQNELIDLQCNRELKGLRDDLFVS